MTGSGISVLSSRRSRRALTPSFTKMKRVILESPYAGDVERNFEYGCACLRDSIMRGEAPFASHLLFTQPKVLNDDDSEERKLGIEAGLAWCEVSDGTVVYEDYGISRGMQFGIDRATTSGKPVEYRRILPPHERDAAKWMANHHNQFAQEDVTSLRRELGQARGERDRQRAKNNALKVEIESMNADISLALLMIEKLKTTIRK